MLVLPICRLLFRKSSGTASGTVGPCGSVRESLRDIVVKRFAPVVQGGGRRRRRVSPGFQRPTQGVFSQDTRRRLGPAFVNLINCLLLGFLRKTGLPLQGQLIRKIWTMLQDPVSGFQRDWR